MFAQDCIETSIPFIRLEDKIHFVLDLMHEFKTDHLAVVHDEQYVATVSENNLLEMDDELTINAIIEIAKSEKISEETHLFDVLKKCNDINSYAVAVVTSENNYIGITSPQKILEQFTAKSALSASGGILLLEVEAKNYSLTEISRIVESNNAMILQTMLSTQPNNSLRVSIKINKVDLKEIQASFERYNYNVIA
ncbi:MAG TPA: hypothetical protein PK431_14420, partial [Chitinophagales bacterium]|nr:hypothetical protein [Chitinophagales bacterium]